MPRAQQHWPLASPRRRSSREPRRPAQHRGHRPPLQLPPRQHPDRAAEHEKVREGCKALAHFLDELLPGGREKSLALTNLEQTMMWANAAVARQTQAGA
ncbi:Acb2/Tad1 domain-containing protein [Rhodococcus sp. DMF-1]|uniref:Acb2/Tad1 domain-containing protein n=1 Tax=Rhodococcus sp. DMF-1 TaxID=2907624 RepID=UPI002DD4467E|nr:hypothetical protein [Rhodococcus sp. DMF-1]